MLNRKARFEYNILDEFRAGIVLSGAEVKSLREGKGDINDSYCYISNGEIFIKNMYVAPYEKSAAPQEPKRDRKLLLNKHEIRKIIDKMKDKSMTIVPLAVDISALIKVRIGIGKGKKQFDKKQSIKERDIDRETSRNL